jgi:hypothetical protein
VITVRLGNNAALEQGRIIPGNQVTTVRIPEQHDDAARLRNIVHADGLWAVHSARPAAWVESTDPDLEKALADHFNCPVGEPDGWTR